MSVAKDCDIIFDDNIFSNLMKSTSSLESITGHGPSSESEIVEPRSRWGRRATAAIPWALLLGFVALTLLLFGDRLQTEAPVDVATVVTLRNTGVDGNVAIEKAPSANSWKMDMLFQSSGWIEPAPLPIKATALVNGVVEKVHVLEGEKVKAGQVLAELIKEDFELDVETAQNDLDALHAAGLAHESAIDVAIARIATLDKLVEAGQMKCLELEDRQTRLEKAGSGAISEEAMTLARLRLETHSSEVDALEISRVELEADVARLEAGRGEFGSKIRRAETELARRNLALSRTQIKSPVDGVVLRLLAVPGQKRMLEMDDVDSATVAILYQPDSLQARIDVPLEEAARLAVGQSVRLRSNFLPDRVFRGTITRIVGEADLQRNTLQAKVRVIDPDERLRPEMLCRAEFLGSESSETGLESDRSSSTQVSIFVSKKALVSQGDGKGVVWALSPSGERLEARSLRMGEESRDDHVSVLDGLRPGDRVVINPGVSLFEGMKVKPINPSVKL